MKTQYCSNCKKEMGFKRALGWGTFFAAVLTAGFWLLIIPFYPKRCIACGTSTNKSSLPSSVSSFSAEKKPWYKTAWGILLILIGVAMLGNIINRNSTNDSTSETAEKPQQPKTSQSPSNVIDTKPKIIEPITINSYTKDDKRVRLAEALTKEFRGKGFNAVTIKSDEKEHKKLQIHVANITQASRLTDGELTSLLGSLLEPEIVSKLKKAGFQSGVVIDGNSRNYDFEISTQYYEKLTEFYKNLSGGR